MKISEIGMKRVFCVCPDSTLADVADMMRKTGVGILPVCDNDNGLLGIITDRDIVINCIAKGNNPQSCSAADFMIKNPLTVSSDTNIEEAARMMAEGQVRRLPVVDNNKLVGMVSLGDISLAIQDNSELVADTLRKISARTHGARSH